MDVERGAVPYNEINESGVPLIFKDINFEISSNISDSFCSRSSQNNGSGKRDILKGACGVLRPGRITFILGPSGAGKTSLLNILADRRKNGVTGSVESGGKKAVLVPQHAALLDTLTAKETLLFAAALKLPKHSLKEHILAVEQVTNQLGIQDVLNTRAGRLSGGEMKRLTISCELLSDPDIMLLDEPTSGLDSVSSMSVIRALRCVAQSGRTVACVVHQPSSKLYASADDVILLSDGKITYAGPVCDVAETLRRANFACPQYYNVADYLLEIASGEHSGNIRMLETEAKNYAYEWSNTANNYTIDKTDKVKPIETEALLNNKRNSVDNEMTDGYNSSTCHQLKTLLWRCSIGALRDVHLTQIRLVCHLIVALLLGALYHGAGEDAARVTSNTSCVFFFLLFLFFSNAMPTIHTFPVEAEVVLQQHLNKWYSLPAYCGSKIISDLPIQLLCATTFVIPAWWLTSQPWEAHRLGLAWCICVLITILAQTFGLVVGAACGVKLGLFVVPAANIPMLMFSEFFIPFKEMPSYLQPFATISYFRYSFDAFIQTVYGFNREKLGCPIPFCFFRYPQKYLNHLGLTMHIATDITALVAWIVILQLSLYTVLKIRVWKACR